VNSGTDALILALRALQIGPGAEVVTHANAFNATVAAIECVGAIPVLVDAEESTFLVDRMQLSDAMTDNTRAIIPVHLYGKPTPMMDILDLATRLGIDVVEDAAQAHGARIHGKTVGCFGRLACFSFHPSKNLAAAGDAGAIVTNEESLVTLIEMDRALGQSQQNVHARAGLNSKLDAMQAVVLSSKLPKLQTWNEARGRVAGQYRDYLKDLPLGFQAISSDETHVYHLFQIRTPHRDRLLEHLQRRGIDAVVRYPTPIHRQQAFTHRKWKAGQFPVAERLANELLALPIRPDMSVSEVAYVAEQVRTFFGAPI
jgi:dTDP-4-amino-4,6-dideoxygalactose transaminase